MPFFKDIWQQLHADAPTLPVEGLEERERATHLATSLTKLHELDGILLHSALPSRAVGGRNSAESLGMSEAAVSKRLQRALRRLKEMMDDGHTA